MKHTAPYKEFPGPQGAKFFAPVLNVQISRLDQNAPRTKRFEVRIDSGASRCVFHFSIGAHIGLDLKSGELSAITCRWEVFSEWMGFSAIFA